VDLRFAVLGPVRVWRDGVELRPGPPTQRTLPALLVARAGRPVPLAEIVAVLWGDHPPASAVNVVHRHVGLLRRRPEPDLPTREPGRWLVRAGGGYRLDVPADSVDLLRFRALRERSRREPAAAAGLLLEALELWSGPAAAGVDSPVFAELDGSGGTWWSRRPTRRCGPARSPRCSRRSACTWDRTCRRRPRRA
jgi:DNA-binding SARP family transcriptional activator